jgi:hypothetical protein
VETIVYSPALIGCALLIAGEAVVVEYPLGPDHKKLTPLVLVEDDKNKVFEEHTGELLPTFTLNTGRTNTLVENVDDPQPGEVTIIV